jgi:hypothetical protein
MMSVARDRPVLPIWYRWSSARTVLFYFFLSYTSDLLWDISKFHLCALESRWPPEEAKAEVGAMVEVPPWIHHHHHPM